MNRIAVAAALVALFAGAPALRAAPSTLSIDSVDAKAGGGLPPVRTVSGDALHDAVNEVSKTAQGATVSSGAVGPGGLVAASQNVSQTFGFPLEVFVAAAGAGPSGAAEATVTFSSTSNVDIFGIATSPCFSDTCVVDVDGVAVALAPEPIVGPGTHTFRISATSAANAAQRFAVTCTLSTTTSKPNVAPAPDTGSGDLHWKAHADGAWTERKNWNPLGVPGAEARVFFDPVPPSPVAIFSVSNSGQRQVRDVFVRRAFVRMSGIPLLVTESAPAHNFEVGQAGALEFSAATLTTRSALVGAAPKSTDRVSGMLVKNGATWVLDGDLDVGDVNSASVEFTSSSLQQTGANRVQIGARKGSVGALSFEDSLANTMGGVSVGAADKSTGRVDLRGDCGITSGAVVVAAGDKSTGTVEFSEESSSTFIQVWTINGALDVGGAPLSGKTKSARGGLGKLTVGPAATVDAASLSVGAGRRKGKPCEVNVKGAGAPGGDPPTLIVSGAVEVGAGGPAFINVTRGGEFRSGSIRIAPLGEMFVVGKDIDDATATPTLAVVTGDVSVEGSSQFLVGPGGDVRVSGGVTVGGGARGSAILGVSDGKISAGALVVGGTNPRAIGLFGTLSTYTATFASVRVLPGSSFDGSGVVSISGTGPAAVFRNEGKLFASASEGRFVLFGEFDLEQTGRMEAGISAADDRSVAPFLFTAKFMKLAGTLAISCNDFDPVPGQVYAFIDAPSDFTVTSDTASIRTEVRDHRHRLRRSHAVVSNDHVDVVID